MVFDVVNGPDGALHVLHPFEAFVQRQIVSHSVLKILIGTVIIICHNFTGKFPWAKVFGPSNKTKSNMSEPVVMNS